MFVLYKRGNSMDKYQKYILDKFGIKEELFIFYRCCPIENEIDGSSIKYGDFNEDKDEFNVIQDEDINKTKYVLIFGASADKYTLISGVFVCKNDQWIEIPCINDEYYRIIVDFNDKISAVKFLFINRIANDYILKITYTEADRDRYFEKVEKEKKDALEKAANIKVATGVDLVNIYFQPCCDEYDHTEILLYIPREEICKGRTSNDKEVIDVISWSLIKKCKVSADDFYQSINGLAYGKYSVILKQYDKNNNIIIQTDYIIFTISEPQKGVRENIVKI